MYPPHTPGALYNMSTAPNGKYFDYEGAPTIAQNLVSKFIQVACLRYRCNTETQFIQDCGVSPANYEMLQSYRSC